MSGVVVEVRVKEGHEVKKGDPLCGKAPSIQHGFCVDSDFLRIISAERHEGEDFLYPDMRVLTLALRWNPL